jgi:hypothetical protein
MALPRGRHVSSPINSLAENLGSDAAIDTHGVFDPIPKSRFSRKNAAREKRAASNVINDLALYRGGMKKVPQMRSPAAANGRANRKPHMKVCDFSDGLIGRQANRIAFLSREGRP